MERLSEGDQALADVYHRTLWDVESVEDPFVRWMMRSTGMKIARGLAQARGRALAAWTAEHGEESEAWPLPHPPAVLWTPSVANAACLGCTWLARCDHTARGCAREARRHATGSIKGLNEYQEGLLTEPLTVWRTDGPPDVLESDEPVESLADDAPKPRKRTKAKAGSHPVGFLTSIPRNWKTMTHEEQNAWAAVAAEQMRLGGGFEAREADQTAGESRGR